MGKKTSMRSRANSQHAGTETAGNAGIEDKNAAQL